MSHAIKWLVQGQLILFRVFDTVTPAELAQTDTIVLNMLEQTEKPDVHIVFDASQLTDMPSIDELLTLKYLQHPRIGWIIPVGADAWIRYQGNVVGKSAGVRFRFMDNLDAALKFLHAEDPTLPDLTAHRSINSTSSS